MPVYNINYKTLFTEEIWIYKNLRKTKGYSLYLKPWRTVCTASAEILQFSRFPQSTLTSQSWYLQRVILWSVPCVNRRRSQKQTVLKLGIGDRNANSVPEDTEWSHSPKLPLTGFAVQCHGAGGLKVPLSELLSREQAVPRWSSLPPQTTGQRWEKNYS